LRPRVTWDRMTNGITARPGAKMIAITSGGTIPDRGLYGVFLAGAEKGRARVGELDEEMVFESRVGETFLLGASTWRIEEITHDRVLVTPAPGQPGKMPFWRADAAERTVPFGERIGRLVREVSAMQPAAAVKRLTKEHDLDELAAKNFLQYLQDQRDATGAIPDDRTVVIERVLDDLGDWRVCVLTPFGGRIHAPWAMAVAAKVRDELAIDVETMWSDDGFIVRFPDTEAPPRAELATPDPDEVEQLVMRQLGASSMFAAKFREAAARAERRAQALAIDQAQLRELLGEPELRELLDPDALNQLELELQHLDERHKAKSVDAIHDLLLRIGDLSLDEIEARYAGPSSGPSGHLRPARGEKDLQSPRPAERGEGGRRPGEGPVGELLAARRIIEVQIAREKRFIAIEDASRYRDALGTPMSRGVPERYLQPVADPTGDLVLRYARTHGPFTPA